MYMLSILMLVLGIAGACNRKVSFMHLVDLSYVLSYPNSQKRRPNACISAVCSMNYVILIQLLRVDNACKGTNSLRRFLPHAYISLF